MRIPKKPKIETKIENVDTEELILNIVNHFGFIRRNELFEQLKKGLENGKNDKNETKMGETTYSQPFISLGNPANETEIHQNLPKHIQISDKKVSLVTFNRILRRLIKTKKLKNLKYPLYQRLGINGIDKKASYITPYSTFDSIGYYDQVLKQVEDQDPLKRRNALIEIESLMDNVMFTPDQLFKLSNLLSQENQLLWQEYKLGENIVRIIFNSIDRKGVFPSNLEDFQQNILSYLERNDGKIATNTKHYIIHMLGLLNNKIVIEMLKREIMRGHIDYESLVNEGYGSWAVAKLIEDSRKELFDFQNTLGEKESLIVFRIRKHAKDHLSTYHLHYSLYKDKLVGLT